AGVRNVDELQPAAANHALAFEAIEHNCNALRIVIGERSYSLKHGHRTSQSAEGLRHFEADWSGANDNEMFWPLLEIKNGFVGQVGPAAEPGDWRHRRRRSGGDHETPRADFDFTCRDRVAVLEL